MNQPRRGEPVAPVVADDAALDEPWPYQLVAPERRSEARAWATIGCSAVIALWLVVLSLAQISARQVAIPTLERGLVALSDIDNLIALHEPDLCNAAAAPSQEPVPLLGFPVHDVTLQPSEVHCPGGHLDRGTVRALVLSRGAELVYLRGTDALTDPGRTAEAVSPFSGSGVVRLLLNNIGAGVHDRTAVAAWVLAGASLVAALVTLLIGRRGRRSARLGATLFSAGLPLLLATAVFWLILGQVTQRAGDPMLREFIAIARALAWLPARDATVIIIAGTLLLLPARFRAR